MLIKAKTTFSVTAALILNGDDDLIVGTNVALSSSGGNAVEGRGNNQTLTINGILSGRIDGIDLSKAVFGGRATLTIGKNALIQAGDDAVQVINQAFDIVNHGRLVAMFGFNVFNSDSTSRITNTGTVITGQQGVIASTDGRLILENTGRMISQGFAYLNSGEAVDVILNKGFMQGDISLRDGNDVYDGRGGRVIGTIEGGVGNDRFVPGAARDVIDGGDDIDTLDFRLTGGVHVALDGAFAGTGAAKGGSYESIENILGSARGNDILSGDDAANALSGSGGNDRLIGGGGEDFLLGGSGRDRLTGGGGGDFLTGGTGRDSLSGGSGDDAFVFNSPRDRADVISDFSNAPGNDDNLRMASVAFGFPQAPLVSLDPEKFFHAGRTNQAQDRDDRFIFRTGDETLWFDRDGKGGKGPVLIADFSDGVRLTADDFVLF